MSDQFVYSGNQQILHKHKVAFLCSRKCPANIVLKSYDWAIEQRKKGNCVISGFHSKIEADVFHFLLKGRQPVILALSRGLKIYYDQQVENCLKDERLLIISPFDDSVKRITVETAKRRNQFMSDLADEVLIAYASPRGNLLPLISCCIKSDKRVFSFDVPENQHLFDMGVQKYSD